MANKFLVGVVLGIASVLACCAGDKDILLRSQSNSAPVFSSSIDSIPVQSAATNQQNLYKSPGLIHSSASASASAHNNVDQGRNQGGYAPSSVLNYELGGSSDSSYHPSSNIQNFIPYDQPPQQAPPQQQQQSSQSASSSSSVEHISNGGSASSSNQYGAPHQQPSYTYYYQHYPSSSNSQGSGVGGGWSDGGGDGGSSIFGDLGGLQIPSLGGGGGLGSLGGGLGGLKGLGVLGVIAKGILAIKPFLIIGLLILIALPILFLLLPIPIVTITGQAGTISRSARSSQIATYLTQLSGKVLNSEECLERIICKLPQGPEKYQTRAKLIWDEYGTKLVKNERVSRGLDAYFESSSQKNKNLKCNQKFKCSNKYL